MSADMNKMVQGLRFAEDECRLELERLKRMKKLLVEAIDQLDADKPITALKLGAAVSRVVAGIDWAHFNIRRGAGYIKGLADGASGKADVKATDNTVRREEVLS